MVWLRYDTLSVVLFILRVALLCLGVGDEGAVIGRGLSLRPQHFFFFLRFLPMRWGYEMEWNADDLHCDGFQVLCASCERTVVTESETP